MSPRYKYRVWCLIFRQPLRSLFEARSLHTLLTPLCTLHFEMSSARKASAPQAPPSNASQVAPLTPPGLPPPQRLPSTVGTNGVGTAIDISSSNTSPPANLGSPLVLSGVQSVDDLSSSEEYV
jgi:hypothetical protein